MAPGPSLASTWTQFHPPKPQFTEKQLPDLKDKVYIVSGSNTGVGKEVARLLYTKNAKVYVAARSEQKAKTAIEDIRKTAPSSKGELVFLPLDLSDLNKTKESALAFLAKEKKLHVLFNNAGAMPTTDEALPKTAQGYESCLGVNCIATHLFTRLLTPTLIKTAQSEPRNTVRVVWLSSFSVEIFAAEDVGVSLDNLDYHIPKPPLERYGISKTGDWALGVEYARRYKSAGIVSVPINPGNLTSELGRDQAMSIKIVAKIVNYPTINGAYTELFAGLSPEVTLERSGDYVAPFGRFYPVRKDLSKATKPESEGGNGGCQKFYDWVEEQIQPYL